MCESPAKSNQDWTLRDFFCAKCELCGSPFFFLQRVLGTLKLPDAVIDDFDFLQPVPAALVGSVDYNREATRC